MLHVLFVCEHNSARSQMAEAFLKRLGGDAFTVESCGLEAGTLNPLVVACGKDVLRIDYGQADGGIYMSGDQMARDHNLVDGLKFGSSASRR